jgi:hypothetical protein
VQANEALYGHVVSWNETVGSARSCTSVRQQLSQAHRLVGSDDHASCAVSWIQLPDELSAAPTGSAHGSSAVDSHNQLNCRFPGLEHLSNGSMLGAKPETTRSVDTHARIDMTGSGQEGRSNVSRGAVGARPESARELGRRCDEFCWSQRCSRFMKPRCSLTPRVRLQVKQIIARAARPGNRLSASATR